MISLPGVESLDGFVDIAAVVECAEAQKSLSRRTETGAGGSENVAAVKEVFKSFPRGLL